MPPTLPLRRQADPRDLLTLPILVTYPLDVQEEVQTISFPRELLERVQNSGFCGLIAGRGYSCSSKHVNCELYVEGCTKLGQEGGTLAQDTLPVQSSPRTARLLPVSCYKRNIRIFTDILNTYFNGSLK